VDLLCCMAAGRELSNMGTRIHSMGAAGREVRWEDLPHFYWDEGFGSGAESDETSPVLRAEGFLFRGISTTKNLPYSRYQLIRLDPGESEVLNRIDFVTDLHEFVQRAGINLVYKLFVVALGYPLGDIARQLGLSPLGPDTPAGARPLYLQELARPDFHRWARVQRALFLINRFTFRMALEGLELEAGAPGCYSSYDPLGRLCEPVAFRCFLLHHWDFDEEGDAAPEGAPDPVGDTRRRNKSAGSPIETTDDVRAHLQEHLGIDDPRSNDGADYAGARAYCRDQLGVLTEAWVKLVTAIERCYQAGFTFKDLISSGEYKDRWRALQKEGYLFTYLSDTAETPVEPEAIERFSMRTKYMLVNVGAQMGQSQ
jgi:hypothetical protein